MSLQPMPCTSQGPFLLLALDILIAVNLEPRLWLKGVVRRRSCRLHLSGKDADEGCRRRSMAANTSIPKDAGQDKPDATSHVQTHGTYSLAAAVRGTVWELAAGVEHPATRHPGAHAI
ncbi:hypothetical protein P154DRAFT_582292 [Amniculicola lignicola CBS 123094]|uniref:Uncharacterized protein n=1 Tax=Amniculicola lignicola CBS 123094 TaxID=1392246 RepID=A0A6A5VYZ9_9PLEO|nr:hypothetical protein P154DRAFT_582292 [Amniculicola lignicola CBS 123094]